MKITSFLKKVLPVFLVGFLWSCDDDFSPVGSDVVGSDNLGVETLSIDVTAYNKATGAVQANGLLLNSLGVVDNPVFGKTIASYVTQLILPANTNPVQGIINGVVTNVELTVPYYFDSSQTTTDGDGNRTFVLDSVYGEGKFKLNIYESGYYLNDFDPSTNFEEYQKYYSDMYDQINNAKNPLVLNDSPDSSQNAEFFFSNEEHVVYEVDNSGEQVVKERLNPQMKIQLNTDFFQNKFFNAPQGQIDNNNTFKDYFRGVFFQVEDLGLGSHLGLLDFSGGAIKIEYTYTNTDGQEISSDFSLSFSGNAINLLQNQFSDSYQNALNSSNEIEGDAKLYLKGGDGSVAFVDLFAGENQENSLDSLRLQAAEENWLINEANLVFYIDQEQMNANPFNSYRIYVYNAEANVPLIDYVQDGTSVVGRPKYNKYVYGGILEKIEGYGYRYKVRVTKHILTLLKNPDAENVKLAVAVIETPGTANYSLLQGENNSDSFKLIPLTSIVHPFGTVLYGNNASEDKRLKLEILYTKP